jgi:hypothetical protein
MQKNVVVIWLSWSNRADPNKTKVIFTDLHCIHVSTFTCLVPSPKFRPVEIGCRRPAEPRGHAVSNSYVRLMPRTAQNHPPTQSTYLFGSSPRTVARALQPAYSYVQVVTEREGGAFRLVEPVGVW